MQDCIHAFYDDDAKRYDSRWLTRGGSRTARIQGKIVKELISCWSGYRILEVGPGTGRFSINLVECADTYFAADLSSKMLQFARERLLHATSNEIEMCQASFYSLPFHESSFDALFSVNVLNHVPDIEAALAEISRVLKPGGKFLVSFANASSFFLPAALVVNKRGNALGKQVYSQWRPFRSFTRMVEKAGLDINEIRGNVHIPKWLDFPIARSILFSLDIISRNGPLRRLAPTIFLSGIKAVA